jgi:circadian clock protein KaiB
MTPQSLPSKGNRWSLVLFISGREHPKSVAAYSTIKRICEEHLPGDYSLVIVDINEAPDVVASEQILAVPTLLRKSPMPARRIIGDLVDSDRVLVSLGLSPVGSGLAR